MLRVAFVNHHGGTPAGAERSLEAYLRRVPSDVDPYLILFEDGVYADSIRTLNIPVFVLSGSKRLMSITSGNIRAGDAVVAARQALRLRSLLKALRVDVVVTNNMKAHVVGSIAARLSGVPVVTWLKEIPHGIPLLAVRVISRACAVQRIACSQAVARNLNLPRSSVLVPAIEVSKTKPLIERRAAKASLGLPCDKLIFMMIGRIARLKGQDEFIRAATRVVTSGVAKVHFAIVGSPTFRDDFKFAPEIVQLTRNLGMEQHVTFLPWLDDPSVAYGACDLLCNASRNEGFGRTSVEAALHGVPILCFDTGGAQEAVIDHVSGTVVPAGNTAAFAAAMAAYCADPVALRRQGAAASVYARRNDADELALSFFEIIRRAASKRRRSKPSKRVSTAGSPKSSLDVTELKVRGPAFDEVSQATR